MIEFPSGGIIDGFASGSNDLLQFGAANGHWSRKAIESRFSALYDVVHW
jgi:alcohol dehydrogenase YqhD (iron-dependent ADH family)